MSEQQLYIGNYIQEVTTLLTVSLVAATASMTTAIYLFGGWVSVSTEESHAQQPLGQK